MADRAAVSRGDSCMSEGKRPPRPASSDDRKRSRAETKLPRMSTSGVATKSETIQPDHERQPGEAKAKPVPLDAVLDAEAR